MIYSGWSLWVEWDHIFLESKNLSFAPIGAGVAFTENVRRDFDKVLVGLNWRFGGGSGPVRASY